MEGFGTRLQYLAFECLLNAFRLAELKTKLQIILKQDEDQVLFISLGSITKDSNLVIDTMGKPYTLRTRIMIG